MTTEPATPRAGRTRDAHGRVVKLLDPIPIFALRQHDVVDAEKLERIVEELEPGARGRRVLVILSLVLVAVVMIGVLISVAMEGRAAWDDLISAVTNPALFGGIIGGVIAPWIAAREARLKRVRRVMLHHRCCPHCGYGLDGVPAHIDGTTVCPECGCAWRLDEAEAEAPTAEAPKRSRSTVTLLILLGLGLAGMLAAGVVYLLRV